MTLDLLIKSEYQQGLLKYYRKLLEGLTDDERFKDMISVITFGSSEGDAKGNENDDGTFEVSKKSEKGFIPKLAGEHRL